MGMLHWDSEPRVKTKEEKKQDKIDDIRFSIDNLIGLVKNFNREIESLTNPKLVKEQIDNANKRIKECKKDKKKLEKKLNKLTRKD